MSGHITTYGIDERGGHWLQTGPADCIGLNVSGDFTVSSTTATFTAAGIVYTGGKMSVNNSTLNLPEIDFFLHVLYNDGEIDLNDSIVNGNIFNQFPASVVKTSGNVTLNGGIASSGALNIAPASVLHIGASPNGSRVIQVPTFLLGAGAKLDIGNNKLILKDAAGSWAGSAYDGITALIVAGRNGGNWSGNGIVTSQSFATTTLQTSIGIATAAQVKNIGATQTALWAGQVVTGSDTLVMYTYGGDANLDGKIDIQDYGVIDFHVPLAGASGWFNGDFNYDGRIDILDYGIIDYSIALQGAPFSTAGSIEQPPAGAPLTAVPEPCSGILMAAGLFLRRRRRFSPDLV
jgi:hypothetical protein